MVEVLSLENVFDCMEWWMCWTEGNGGCVGNVVDVLRLEYGRCVENVVDVLNVVGVLNATELRILLWRTLESVWPPSLQQPHLQTHDTCGDTVITQPYSQSKSYSSKSFNHIELFERISVITQPYYSQSKSYSSKSLNHIELNERISVITKLYSQSKFYVHHNHSTIFRIKITFIL